MPNETSSITIALVLLIWSLGVLAFLGTLIWSRAHPGRLAQWAQRHSFRSAPRPQPVVVRAVTRVPRGTPVRRM